MHGNLCYRHLFVGRIECSDTKIRKHSEQITSLQQVNKDRGLQKVSIPMYAPSHPYINLHYLNMNIVIEK